MAERSIPEPTNTDFSIAFSGSLMQAKIREVNTLDEGTRAFIEHQAEVIAQLNAEARWLRNMTHPK